MKHSGSEYQLLLVKSNAIRLLLIILFLISGLLLITGCSKNQDNIDLPIYDGIGGDFTLPSTLGKKLILSDYHGKVVLVNFGYTSCPDVCPMVLTRLARISNQLIEQFAVGSNELQTIFISVDPERDTLDKLTEYLAFFNPDFIGISGSLVETDGLAKQYAVFYEKQADKAMGYQMAHTDKIFLLDKKGRIRGLYDKTDPDEQLINDIHSLISAGI